MEKIIVSKCLLGYPCRYDGKSVPCKEVIDLKDRYELIPVCPMLPLCRGFSMWRVMGACTAIL